MIALPAPTEPVGTYSLFARLTSVLPAPAIVILPCVNGVPTCTEVFALSKAACVWLFKFRPSAITLPKTVNVPFELNVDVLLFALIYTASAASLT